MHILCFSPLFPPSANSESFCGGKMVLALLAQGHHVQAIRLHHPGKAAAEDHSRMWTPLQARTISVSDGSKVSRWGLFRLALAYRTLNGLRWISSAVSRACEAHNRSPFDLVYSRSLPWIAHVAGYWAATKLRIPWVANINDPWDTHHFPQSPEFGRRGPMQIDANRWLARTMKRADLVTFPSKGLMQFTCSFAPRRGPAAVLPHIGAPPQHRPPPAGFHLVHSGRMGAGEVTGRSGAALLRALSELVQSAAAARASTRLTFVGPEDSATTRIGKQLGLGGCIHNTGRVSYDESLRIMNQASVAVLIEGDMKTGIYLPSKFCDYVRAGLPVLALSPAQGTIADLASQGIMRASPGDDKAVFRCLQVLFKAHQENRLAEFAPSHSLVKSYDASVVGDGFMSLLREYLPVLRSRFEAVSGEKTLELR